MIDITRLGAIAYPDAWKIQHELLQKRIKGEIPDTLLVLEHPHVFTMGRKFSTSMPELKEEILEWQGVPVFYVERGGEATYHGPGQIVLYPIFQLSPASGPKQFLRLLEKSIQVTLARYGIAAYAKEGATGVWLTNAQGVEKKIASLGIALRYFVTYHGLALNITTDLTYFQKIIPCGFSPNIMTSMQEILSPKILDREQIISNLITDLCNCFIEEKASWNSPVASYPLA